MGDCGVAWGWRGVDWVGGLVVSVVRLSTELEFTGLVRFRFDVLGV